VSKFLDWKKIVPACIAIALLFASFYKVDFKQLWHALIGLNILYLLGAITCAVLMNWAKGMRWRALINDVKPISKLRVFALFHVGQMINLSLPMLTGQAARIVTLAKQEGLSKTYCFTTVVMEVLFDAITLVVVVYVASFIFAFPEWLRAAEIWAAIVVGLVLAMVIVLVRNERGLRYFSQKTARRRFPKSYKKLQKWTTSITSGVASLRSGRGIFWVSFYSLLVWIFHIGISVMLIQAFKLDVPAWAGVVVVIVNSFLLLVPISPGNLGSFQIAVIWALSLFGVGHAESAAFSIVLHFMDVAPVFAIGIYFLFSSHITFKKLRDDTVREVEEGKCAV
jgi:hypothetical protein